jgi:hypothetical protein
MLDIRTLEALEKLFASGTHGTGRFSIRINVDYGSIVVEEIENHSEEVTALEERIKELENKLDEISSLASY